MHNLVRFFIIICLYSKFVSADNNINYNFDMNCLFDKGNISEKNEYFYGKELNLFRQNVSKFLEKGYCQENTNFKEYCKFNNKWVLDTETTLIQTFCSSGAYLTNTAWFFQNHHGIYPALFKLPRFKWDFDKINNNKLISIHSDGFDEISILANATFNPKTNILKHSSYCCAGDMSYEITWLLDKGNSIIHKVIIDNISDGKVSPQLILNYK